MAGSFALAVPIDVLASLCACVSLALAGESAVGLRSDRDLRERYRDRPRLEQRRHSWRHGGDRQRRDESAPADDHRRAWPISLALPSRWGRISCRCS